MNIIKKPQVTVNDYKENSQRLIRSTKPCKDRDLPCSFRPEPLVAPPR